MLLVVCSIRTENLRSAQKGFARVIYYGTQMMTRASIKDLILVYLLVFISGAQLARLWDDKFLILVFLLTSVAWLFYTNRKLDMRFVLYAVAFFSFLFIIHLYTGGSLKVTSVVSTIMKLGLAYFVMKVVGERFADAYIRVVVFLAAVSLFGYTTDVLRLFDGVIRQLPPVGSIGYEGLFYVYRFREHIDRNCSIFFEPGAYQVFLNAALFLLLFLKTGITGRKKSIYITLLLVTLVTTFSTTGFLIFAAMFALFLVKSSSMTIARKAALVSGISAVVILFSAQFHEIVIQKVSSFVAEKHITDSKERRGFDTHVDLTIFKDHVFGVGYDNYTSKFSSTGLINPAHAGSSNGITKVLAIYGLPFALFLFGSYLWAIHRLLGGFLMTVVPFGMLVMFFIGEAYYVFTPYCLAVIAAAFVYERAPQAREVPLDVEPAGIR